LLLSTIVVGGGPETAHAQEYRARADRLCEIRKQKFDTVLPTVMRENHVDMWIVAMREGSPDPNAVLFGDGYVPLKGYYIFTDKGGGRIERLTLRIEGKELEHCGAFDSVGSHESLHDVVAKRDPKVIAVDMATEIGVADGLSYSMHQQLVEELGETYAGRLLSAEKLNSDYRSLQTPLEIRAFGDAVEFTRVIAEEALSSEVISPDRTTLSQVSDWIADRMMKQALTGAFESPGVWIIGPHATQSPDAIIHRGDLVGVDFGVVYLNKWTDAKTIGSVLRPGETAPPPDVQKAFNKAVAARDIVARATKPGIVGTDMQARAYTLLEARSEYTTPRNQDASRAANTMNISVFSHSVGDFGNGSGAWFFAYPLRRTFPLRATQAMAVTVGAATSIPSWSSEPLHLGFEDDGVITADGIQFIYPPVEKIVLVK
jgi:Xaa-Pro aminopeptidase